MSTRASRTTSSSRRSRAIPKRSACSAIPTSKRMPTGLSGLKINGVDPTYDNISSFAYPGARPLYIYVKKAHLEAIPGLKDFVAEWAKSWGKGGPLSKLGLVAEPGRRDGEERRRCDRVLYHPHRRRPQVRLSREHVASHPALARLRAWAGRMAGGARPRLELQDARAGRAARRPARLLRLVCRAVDRGPGAAVHHRLERHRAAAGHRSRCSPILPPPTLPAFGMQRDRPFWPKRARSPPGRLPPCSIPLPAPLVAALPRGDRAR